MMKRDREIGEVDVAGRIAPEGQPVALDPRRADDLASLGAVRDLAEKESHSWSLSYQ